MKNKKMPSFIKLNSGVYVKTSKKKLKKLSKKYPNIRYQLLRIQENQIFNGITTIPYRRNYVDILINDGKNQIKNTALTQYIITDYISKTENGFLQIIETFRILNTINKFIENEDRLFPDQITNSTIEFLVDRISLVIGRKTISKNMLVKFIKALIFNLQIIVNATSYNYVHLLRHVNSRAELIYSTNNNMGKIKKYISYSYLPRMAMLDEGSIFNHSQMDRVLYHGENLTKENSYAFNISLIDYIYLVNFSLSQVKTIHEITTEVMMLKPSSKDRIYSAYGIPALYEMQFEDAYFTYNIEPFNKMDMGQFLPNSSFSGCDIPVYDHTTLDIPFSVNQNLIIPIQIKTYAGVEKFDWGKEKEGV